jgi:hypothetical protein
MGQPVTVEVQPGETLRFPPYCVNCGNEATETLRLRKRRGRVTREIEAPLCADCHHELQRLSGDEERMQRMGWFFGALALFLGLIAFLLLLPGWLSFVPRLLLALVLAGGVGALVVFYFRRNSAKHARPEKLAVRNAAHLHDFSWRATTFAFENEDYARQFIELNSAKLLESKER